MISYHVPPHNSNIAIKSMGATFTPAAFFHQLAQQLDHILCGHICKCNNCWERDLPPTEWGRKYLCIDYIYCDSDMDVAISVCLRMSLAYNICLVGPTHRFIFDITSSCGVLINKIVNIA